MTDPTSSRNRLIALGLILLTLAVFWPVGRFDFVNYDDNKYITENLDVQQGFTVHALKRAMVSPAGGYWHPLTWISHLIDTHLFGPRSHGQPALGAIFGTNETLPGGHHLHNLLLHAANAVLLWWVLQRMTGLAWPSAWAAAMFAVHPTHVESVAWISERKDTLSVLMMLLTIVAYLRYTEQRSIKRYLVLMLAFVAALMSKPMMVSIPGVLLLLDVWPLNRIRLGAGFWASLKQPLLEKLAMLPLSLAAGIAAILYTRSLNSFITLESLPLITRLQTAVISYARYLGKLFWPSDLTIFYPYPFHQTTPSGLQPVWPMSWTLAALALFVLLTAVVIWQARRRPFLIVGWLWFVGMMLPVIGILVTGDASLADRYTYAPFIGLFIAIAWLARDALVAPAARKALAGLAVATVLASAVGAHRYVWAWQDSKTVFAHALKSHEYNWTAHVNYGIALESSGADPRQTLRHYQRAYDLRPSVVTNTALAYWHLKYGNPADALPHINAVTRSDPNPYNARLLQGRYHYRTGRPDLAAALFREVLAKSPGDLSARTQLTEALIAQNRLDEAEAQLQDDLRANANQPRVHHKLGLIADRRADAAAALKHLEQAIRLDPSFALAHYDYGTLLARLGRYPEAEAALRSALDSFRRDQVMAHGQAEITLGHVLKRLQRPDEAQSHYADGLKLLRQSVAESTRDPIPPMTLAIALKQFRQPDALDTARDAMRIALEAGNQHAQQQLTREFPQLAANQPATTRAAP